MEAHISSEAVLGRKERDPPLQEVTADANQP